MLIARNSSQTNRLLKRVASQEGQALDELFARHRERLRKMVRLRLDRRLRGQFSSSAVLHEVYREACRRIGEYCAKPAQPVFLWFRLLTGQFLQTLHRQYLGGHILDAGQDFSLYRGALPEVNSASLAAQLIGERAPNQAAVRADLLLRLQDALNSMDPMDREVLALCHFEELRDDEVAVVLGIDQEAVMLRYVRALKRLKTILQSIPGFFDSR
jgi:RNA polymerase sigma-70 factor (ECF subfamily)